MNKHKNKNHHTDYNGAGIYCLLNVIDGKAYIGKSLNIKSRWLCHRVNFSKKSNTNPMYHEPIDNFVFMIMIKLDSNIFDLYGSAYEYVYMHDARLEGFGLYNSIGANDPLYMAAMAFRSAAHDGNSFNDVMKNNYGIYPFQIQRSKRDNRTKILEQIL